MKKIQATLKDIAEKLDLSISTVSRALSDHPRISEETKIVVRRMAGEMDYIPNFSAKGIISPQRINAIGVVVPKITYHLYATAISGMEDYANQHGYNIIICQSNESLRREGILINELLASRVAGFAISLSSETNTYDHFWKIKHMGVPLVFFNRECTEVPADRVIIDNYKAAYEAVEHLINTGCRKIAYLGGPLEVQISNKRKEGCLQALKDYGLEIEDRFILHCEFNKENAMNMARKLVYSPEPPDGILAFSDQIALSVMAVCKERNLEIPNRVSIVGFNNEPTDELLDPPLTSVDQPGFEMGRVAAELIINQIREKDKPHNPVTKVLTSNLIIRLSTNRNG